VLAVTGLILLAALAVGIGGTDDLIRATSACFVAVYVLALAAGARMLVGPLRMAAVAALGLICVVAVFSFTYLLVPAVAALACIGLRSTAVRRLQVRRAQRAERGARPSP
jgi:amino acid efflux transporter